MSPSRAEVRQALVEMMSDVNQTNLSEDIYRILNHFDDLTHSYMTGYRDALLDLAKAAGDQIRSGDESVHSLLAGPVVSLQEAMRGGPK